MKSCEPGRCLLGSTNNQEAVRETRRIHPITVIYDSDCPIAGEFNSAGDRIRVIAIPDKLDKALFCMRHKLFAQTAENVRSKTKVLHAHAKYFPARAAL
jgi:hypothetical protein